MSPCILFKKTSDSNMTFLNDGMTINLPYEQAAHEYSLRKRIFWFFSGCPCECSMIPVSLRTQGDPTCHAKKQKSLGR